ncbi:MAG: TonB-dependent receptor [Bacteroidota bacterium]
MHKSLSSFLSFILVLSLLTVTDSFAQTATVRGTISNLEGEPLPGINIGLTGTTYGAATSTEGKYEITNIPMGTYTLVASGVGFRTRKQEIMLDANSVVQQDISLSVSTQELQTVEVIGRRETDYKSDYSFSATKVESQTIDIPQTISTVTKELIQDQQAYRLKDVVKNVAGVNKFSVYDDITIRGFRTFDGNSRLINGLRSYGNFWTSPLLVNIERVEVIKGPASAMFANTNPGGTINMVTKKPLEEDRKSLSFTTGSWNTYRAQADFTGPINEEKTLLYRLNLGYENAESFRDLIKHETAVVAPSISFLPRDGTRVNFDLVYSNINTLLDRGRPIFQNDNSLTSTPIDINLNKPGDFLKQQNLSMTLSLNQQLTPTTSINVSYMKFRFDEQLNEHTFSGYVTRDSATLGFGDRVSQSVTDNLTSYLVQQFRTGDVNHKMLLGYDFISSEFNRTHLQANNVDTVFVGETPRSRPDVSKYTFFVPSWGNRNTYYNTQGIYVQDQLTYGRLQLLLSLRYEIFETPEDRNPSMEDAGLGDDRQTAWLPRVGVVYSILPNLNAYATYATGFEPQAASTNVNPIVGGPFDPLTSNLLEAGAKGNFFDERLFAGLSFYQIEQNNVLVSANNPQNPDLLEQRGQERARGFEVETSGRITPNFSITASYAFNDAVVTESDNEEDIGRLKENAPQHISNLWAKYTLTKGTLEGLGFGLGYSHVGQRNTFDRELQLPAYTVFDAAVYYTVDRFRISANVENIFDELYYAGGYNYQRNFPGNPRNILLNVAYTF